MPHTSFFNYVRTVRFISILFAVFALAVIWGSGPAQAQVALLPGLYQMEGEATCRLSRLPDKSWQLYLWQGAELKGHTQGFAFLGRMVPDASGRRLSGSWQAVPGSCCPGNGRMDLEVTAPDQFSVISFAPSLRSAAWEVIPQADFKRVQDLTENPPQKDLAGGWRLSMWYTDLLPGRVPADPEEGDFWVQAQENDILGAFSAWPGRFMVESPDSQKFVLRYDDSDADFNMTAELKRQNGGLAYSGEFGSTLGQGRITLVRAGLPATPPGSSLGGVSGSLSGIWVDSRTGADFFKITGGDEGFEFTAYGGSLDLPRYLSQGRARPAGQGRYAGRAQDAAGHCCGNQGRLIFRQIKKDVLEVSSVWWPQTAPDPGTPPAQPYLIKRMAQAVDPAAGEDQAAEWPLVKPARAGLLKPEQGAVRVRFNFIPAEKNRIHTLFNQGGYMAELELFIDPAGRLASRLRSDQGVISLTAVRPLATGQDHEAWLVYSSGSRTAIYLDGALAAEAEMPGSWPGSRAPYLVGASRWPKREFSGSIESVELFGQLPDIAAPGAAELTITPPKNAGKGLAMQPNAQNNTVELVAFWHPGQLSHAYAVGPDQAGALQSQGFVRQGPVGRLLRSEAQGAKPLYQHRHAEKGHYVLTVGEKAPKGYGKGELLGYMWTEATPESTQFYWVRAKFKDPLRGTDPLDNYYTTSRENLSSAQESGYGQAVLLGYVLPAKEPPFTPPLLYTWIGSWQGEGWGKFFMGRKGQWLLVFWYYGPIDGPHYFGRFKLSPDGRQAEGYAVGRPGTMATFYRQTLLFDTTSQKGPTVQVESYRVAAPLDDGRLVVFKEPRGTRAMLYKTGQYIPVKEADLLKQRFIQSDYDPQDVLKKRIQSLRAEGRLVER